MSHTPLQTKSILRDLSMERTACCAVDVGSITPVVAERPLAQVAIPIIAVTVLVFEWQELRSFLHSHQWRHAKKFYFARNMYRHKMRASSYSVGYERHTYEIGVFRHEYDVVPVGHS